MENLDNFKVHDHFFRTFKVCNISVQYIYISDAEIEPTIYMRPKKRRLYHFIPYVKRLIISLLKFEDREIVCFV